MTILIVLASVFAGCLITAGISVYFYKKGEEKRKSDLSAVVENLKESFGNISLDALSKTTKELLNLSKSQRETDAKELDSKKGLIDQQLTRMSSELENVSKLVKELEKDRVAKFSELASQLKMTSEQTAVLTKTTSSLKEALAGTKSRGQWGERMAEDVLKIAGFIENINYQKQKTIESAKTRPDFTFLLPRELKLNMDVKFPFDNYLKSVEATDSCEKQRFESAFIKDVKIRMKELTTREYINPEQNTVDYVLMFIPNEQIFSFIQEHDSSLIDESLKNRVILCSPITLFAILAIMRQSIENFNLEKTSNQIISLLGDFFKQWNEFKTKLIDLGRKLDSIKDDYNKINTTRINQLERPLNKIINLKSNNQELITEDAKKDEPSTKEMLI